jgi:two-component system, NarL family, nitrate/nitrite response regulator NarL
MFAMLRENNNLQRNLMQKQNDHDAFSSNLRVLIADDHRMIGEILGYYLHFSEGFEVTYSYCFDSTLEAIQQAQGFDVILLDYRMPGMQGIDSVARVVEANENGRTILMSGNVDSYTLQRAIKVGVRGLIPKAMPAVSVGKIISLINTGEMFIPMGEVTESNLNERFASLTEIERVVLSLAARGNTNKQIGLHLDESEANVKKHMRLVCRKLGARNRAHATLLGREMDLLR